MFANCVLSTVRNKRILYMILSLLICIILLHSFSSNSKCICFDKSCLPYSLLLTLKSTCWACWGAPRVIPGYLLVFGHRTWPLSLVSYRGHLSWKVFHEWALCTESRSWKQRCPLKDKPLDDELMNDSHLWTHFWSTSDFAFSCFPIIFLFFFAYWSK